MLNFIRVAFGRLTAHRVCETCETGLRAGLDEILDMLVGADEALAEDPGTDLEAVLSDARRMLYELRSEFFDYQGPYVPSDPPAGFDRAFVVHDLASAESDECAEDCSGCAFLRESAGGPR